MTRENVEKILAECGIESNKALVTALLNEFNEEKKNAIAETTEKLLEDTKEWVSPEDYKALKQELDNTKEELNSKVKAYADYDDLKKYVEETKANTEKSKRVEFLKAQGCKHPELIMTQLDFEKASYDEEKKTYTGLDDSIKALKTNYKDLFVEAATQHVEINPQPSSNGSDFYEQYKKDHPELKGL